MSMLQWDFAAVIGLLVFCSGTLAKILEEQKKQTARLIEINRKTKEEIP